MRKLVLLLTVCFLALSCQQKPTKVIEETSNQVFKIKTVLVDTRDSFAYTSFHVPGSVNLISSDFLIIKDTKNKKRILDPDLNQTIERLAKKGVSKDSKVILIVDSKKSNEGKKWKWLLNNLEVENVQILTLDEFNQFHKNARFVEPERQDVWTLFKSEQLQNEFILKKANDCFVSWNEKSCLN